MADKMLSYHTDGEPVYIVALMEGARELSHDLVRAMKKIQPERGIVPTPIKAKSYAERETFPTLLGRMPGYLMT